MSRVLIRQLLVNGSGHHLSHLVPKRFNFGKRRVPRRALRTEAASRQRSDTVHQLLPRLIREYDSVLSVLAHAILLPK
jgi:hypothetical protein